MPKSIVGTLAAALLAGLAAFASPASAETQYPWCVEFSGGRDGFSATSCGFVSFAQCMETASGTRSTCVKNPSYRGPSERAAKSRHKKKSE